jgi:hypothetical protein
MVPLGRDVAAAFTIGENNGIPRGTEMGQRQVHLVRAIRIFVDQQYG